MWILRNYWDFGDFHRFLQISVIWGLDISRDSLDGISRYFWHSCNFDRFSIFLTFPGFLKGFVEISGISREISRDFLDFWHFYRFMRFPRFLEIYRIYPCISPPVYKPPLCISPHYKNCSFVLVYKPLLFISPWTYT